MGANDDSSPMVQRRRLRAELRRARQDAGETQEQVAAAMDWSLSKLSRIETGSTDISTSDLKALLYHYKIADPIRIEQLIALVNAKPMSRSAVPAKASIGVFGEHPQRSATQVKQAPVNAALKRQLLSNRHNCLEGHTKTECQCRESERRAVIESASQLPKSRTTTAPISRWDFDERQGIRATRDDDSLRRSIRWHWHLTAQRLVSFVGVSALILAFLDLVKLEGLHAQAAAHLTFACVISGSGGYILRELLTALIGKRRQRNRGIGDDSSSL